MGSDVEKPVLVDMGTVGKQEAKSKHKAPRDCFCKLLNVITALCALLCLVRPLKTSNADALSASLLIARSGGGVHIGAFARLKCPDLKAGIETRRLFCRWLIAWQ